ncbi:UNVERIFIED_CONTAM: hypothetical protein FKN15_029301 [Acipenser sinensis]
MCSYREKKSEPQELMQLEGYTVDYTDPQPGLTGGRAFFNAVKEGDTVVFASDDDQDRNFWVQAMCRATGQSYKPVAPTLAQKHNFKDSERSQKLGIDGFIAADPCKCMHSALFQVLQKQTLQHRMNDSFSCLGWFSPGQVFVLDEYCARYGVRGCHRHLCYLKELTEYAENSAVIDPTLLHYSFAFCDSHVHGNRPDGIGTVTTEEKERFEDIKSRLLSLLENQIVHFSRAHRLLLPSPQQPRTDWLLSLNTLHLALIYNDHQVLMKDISTPVPPDDMKKVIRKCLERAALINYSRLTEYAKIEDTMNQAAPAKKLEDVMRLGELCIEVLQQNEEHHSEAFAWWPEIMAEHAEIFWSLYAVDMGASLEAQPQDSWDSFPLFQLLNNYLRNDTLLCNGKFHKHLQDYFIPLVIRYIDLMESSIAQSIHRGFEQETWQPVKLTVQPPQSYSVGGQRSSGQLTGKPAGARPDYRGRWCAQWYTSSMKAICVWLTDRLDLQLHMYQLKTLIRIVKAPVPHARSRSWSIWPLLLVPAPELTPPLPVVTWGVSEPDLAVAEIKPPSSYRYLGRQRPNRAGRISGRRQHCPAFSPSRHSPTSWKRSWNHPALVPSVVKQATPLASLEGAGVLDLAEFPPVDSTIVALVRAPPVGGLPKDLAYPNSQCRVTKAHLNKDYAAEAQVTRLANTAGLLTAYLDGILQSAPLPEPVASELRLVSGTRFPASKERPWAGAWQASSQAALAVPS